MRVAAGLTPDFCLRRARLGSVHQGGLTCAYAIRGQCVRLELAGYWPIVDSLPDRVGEYVRPGYPAARD